MRPTLVNALDDLIVDGHLHITTQFGAQTVNRAPKIE